MKSYYVSAKQSSKAGKLLKDHLTHENADTLIQSGGVWLNGKRVLSVEMPVSKGETLQVWVDKNSSVPFVWDGDLLVFEDKDILAVYKPAGVAVAPSRDSLVNNLTYAVQGYVGSSYQTVALTRLDKPVRGLVLFAKNKRSQRLLSDLIRNHQLGKAYLALVEPGSLRFSGKIDLPLAFRKKAVVHSAGKPCETRYRRIGECRTMEIYRVIPKTGRRHQIRVHLSEEVSPIVGDRLYGSRQKTNGIGLMAESYRFWFKEKFYCIRVENALERLIQETYGRIQKLPESKKSLLGS